MDDDSSQQSAVTRVIAAAISSRGKTPSPNTSAYSQASVNGGATVILYKNK